MNKLKFLVFFLIGFKLSAQDRHTIRLNVASPVTRIWSFQYEFKFNEKLSLNTTFFYRNKNSIPFANQVDQLAKNRGLGITGVDFEYIFMDKAQIGLRGFSPELRYYFKSKKNPWFVGAFLMVEQFDMEVPAYLPIKYEDFVGNAELPINFDISTLSGGLLIGKKFNFHPFSLDVVIIGPHFGTANKVDAKIDEPLLNRLSTSDREFLRQGVIDRFKLDENYFNVGVEGEEAKLDAKRSVPYFGIRGFGLNLAYTF